MDTDFVTWVNSELKERGWTQTELASRGGFTGAALSKLLSRERMPGVDICKGIARAFGMKDVEVMRLAGLVDQEIETTEYSQAIRNTIRMMKDLDEKDQEDIEALVDAFRGRRLRAATTRKAHGAQKP
jgi:transcriptional regulator with XRE-family HTH domain